MYKAVFVVFASLVIVGYMGSIAVASYFDGYVVFGVVIGGFVGIVFGGMAVAFTWSGYDAWKTYSELME